MSKTEHSFHVMHPLYNGNIVYKIQDCDYADIVTPPPTPAQILVTEKNWIEQNWNFKQYPEAETA